jgi:hypothetical protein
MKNSSWLSEQSILRATKMLYGNYVKMCKDFTMDSGDKRNGCCIMTTRHLTLLFSPGNFYNPPRSTYATHLTWSPATFSISLIEDKTERLPF